MPIIRTSLFTSFSHVTEVDVAQTVIGCLEGGVGVEQIGDESQVQLGVAADNVLRRHTNHQSCMRMPQTTGYKSILSNIIQPRCRMTTTLKNEKNKEGNSTHKGHTHSPNKNYKQCPTPGHNFDCSKIKNLQLVGQRSDSRSCRLRRARQRPCRCHLRPEEGQEGPKTELRGIVNIITYQGVSHTRANVSSMNIKHDGTQECPNQLSKD